MRWKRGATLNVFAGLGLLVALASWALSSPVGAAPDDTYHLPTIWCSWGEHETCARDAQGSFVAPETISKVCTYQRPLVSAACEYQRSQQLVTVGHLQYGGSNVQLEGNAVFHRVLRMFVGPDSERSALIMRLFNVGLAVGMFLWALMVSRGGSRRALALSWLVVIVPVGMFIVSSTNPSGWVVTGVGTYWVFLLSLCRSSGSTKARQGSALAGLVVSTAVAVGARADALALIGGSTVAVIIIAWPHIRKRRVVVAGLVFLAVALGALVATTSIRDRLLLVIQGIGDVRGADTRLVAGGLDPTLNHILELPSFVWALVGGQAPTFAFPTAYLRGLGWLDTGVPSITGLLALCSLVAVFAWGLGMYSFRKVVGLGIATLTLILSILLPLEGVDFAPTFVLQPRYVLPMLFVIVALAALRPQSSQGPRLVLVTLIVIGMVVANGAAQLASLHRYTNGESLPWMRMDMQPNWWWIDAPVGPTGLWILGVIGFTLFAVSVGLISRDKAPLPDSHRSKDRALGY